MLRGRELEGEAVRVPRLARRASPFRLQGQSCEFPTPAVSLVNTLHSTSAACRRRPRSRARPPTCLVLTCFFTHADADAFLLLRAFALPQALRSWLQEEHKSRKGSEIDLSDWEDYYDDVRIDDRRVCLARAVLRLNQAAFPRRLCLNKRT